MGKLFYGDWIVEVVENSRLIRRLVIQGSAGNDGIIYPIAVGTTVAVTGAPGIGWQVMTAVSQPVLLRNPRVDDVIDPIAVGTAVAARPEIVWPVMQLQEFGKPVEDWRPDSLEPVGMDYTLEDGLVVVLSATQWGYAWDDAGRITPREEGHIVLRCRNIEPRLNPWLGLVNPYDFSVPSDGSVDR
jgi:hypothetical protein